MINFIGFCKCVEFFIMVCVVKNDVFIEISSVDFYGG